MRLVTSRTYRPLLSLLAMLSLSLSVSASELRLLYSGNLIGELEPCGCTLDTDFGGLSRRATFIDEQRAAHPNLVAIDSGGLFAAEMGSDHIRHHYILKGLAKLNYDAIGVQWADLTHGLEFLTREPLPLAASNWRDDSLPQSQLIQREGIKLRYFQWLDSSNSPYSATPQLSPASEDLDKLRAALKAAKSRGEITLLGTQLSSNAATTKLPLAEVDILLLESNYELFLEPQWIGNTLALTPGSRGQRIGTLKAQVENGKLVSWQHSVTELPNTVVDAPRMAEWYQAYNDALREEYEQRVAERKQREATVSPYVGATQCKTCHADQYAIWQKTDHAQAFDDLDAVGKGFDSHCVGCHVVGFNQPGGYLDITLTTELAGVQCENCHGGGREHAESAGQVPPPQSREAAQTACASCHVKDHSPHFNFEEYWPRIAHKKAAN